MEYPGSLWWPVLFGKGGGKYGGKFGGKAKGKGGKYGKGWKGKGKYGGKGGPHWKGKGPKGPGKGKAGKDKGKGGGKDTQSSPNSTMEPTKRKSPSSNEGSPTKKSRKSAATKKREFEQKKAQETAKRAAALAERTVADPEMAKKLLLSMALVRENPRTLPATWPPRGSVVPEGFFWAHYPPLEGGKKDCQLCISSLLGSYREYVFEFSIEKAHGKVLRTFYHKVPISATASFQQCARHSSKRCCLGTRVEV